MAELFIAGLVAQTAGSVMGGVSAQQAANQQAENIESAAAYNEQIRKRNFRKAIGTQIAQAASGGSLTGSNFEVIANAAVESDLQGQIDLFNASNQASSLRQQGNQALFSGIMGGIGSAAQGAFIGSELGVFDKFKDVRKVKPDRVKAQYGYFT